MLPDPLNVSSIVFISLSHFEHVLDKNKTRYWAVKEKEELKQHKAHSSGKFEQSLLETSRDILA